MLEHVNYLVLWTTNDCNLRCKYCYANAGDKKEYMTFETAKKAIELPKGSFKLQLAGGEPLLNFELIREIDKYFKKHKPDIKIQVQTNGTTIDDENAREIKAMNIAVGVSLDGPYEINEVLRGSTAHSVNGIKALGAAGVMVNLNCVVTKESIRQIDKLIDWAFYFGNVGGIGLDLLRETGRAEKSEIKKASPEQIKESLWKAHNRSVEIFKLTGKKIVIREIEDAKRQLAGVHTCTNYCHAASGSSVVVLPDGNLYPCGSLAGKSDYYMGNIHDEASYKKIILNNPKPEVCKACKYGELCTGACPARIIINGDGRGFTPEDCMLRKTAFEIIEKEYLRNN